MGKKARRGRRGRRGKGNLSRYLEWYTGGLAVGNVAIIQRNHLEINFDRSFKLVAVHYEICSVGGPSQFNIRGYGPQGKTGAIMETGVRCCGGLPIRGVLRINSPWFPKDTAGTDTLCTVDHICIKGINDKFHLIIALKLEVLLSPEEVQAACPKSFLIQSSSSFPSTSSPLDLDSMALGE